MRGSSRTGMPENAGNFQKMKKEPIPNGPNITTDLWQHAVQAPAGLLCWLAADESHQPEHRGRHTNKSLDWHLLSCVWTFRVCNASAHCVRHGEARPGHNSLTTISVVDLEAGRARSCVLLPQFLLPTMLSRLRNIHCVAEDWEALPADAAEACGIKHSQVR